jgi:hypothetical protein
MDTHHIRRNARALAAAIAVLAAGWALVSGVSAQHNSAPASARTAVVASADDTTSGGGGDETHW